MERIRKMFYFGFVQTALLNIADHPEVLDWYRKIHLTPKVEPYGTARDFLPMVETLVELTSEDDTLYKQLNGFKVVSGTSHLREDDDGQPLAVVYLRTGADMDEVIGKFVDRFAGFEPSGKLQYNMQHGPIVYSSVGDSQFKRALGNDLPKYYDHRTNFARLWENPDREEPEWYDYFRRPFQEAVARITPKHDTVSGFEIMIWDFFDKLRFGK